MPAWTPVPPLTLLPLGPLRLWLQRGLLFETSRCSATCSSTACAQKCLRQQKAVHAAAGTRGAYHSNWGGLTDDHLLTM